MTEDQMKKLAALQAAHRNCMAKSRSATTLAERDTAIMEVVGLMMNEPDHDVQEAFLVWKVRDLNIGGIDIQWPDGTEESVSFREH